MMNHFLWKFILYVYTLESIVHKYLYYRLIVNFSSSVDNRCWDACVVQGFQKSPVRTQKQRILSKLYFICNENIEYSKFAEKILRST